MFLEQSGYNGFLWPTHCISFSWSLLLLWLPSLLLWNIPTHYLQPECVCKCSPTSGSAHFSLPALKKSISPWASKMMPAVATKLAPEAEATTNAGPDLWKATVCPHNHLFRLTPHGGWWGIKLATTTQAKPGWHVGVEFVMRTSPRHEINHVEAERQTDCWVTGSGLRYWVAGVHRWWWLLHEGWSLRATVDRHFSIDLLYHEDESYWVKIITFGHPPLGQTNPGYHPLWVFLPNPTAWWTPTLLFYE